MAKSKVGPNPLFDMDAFKQWQKERKATPEAFKRHYKRANFVERKLQHTDSAGWTALPKRPEMRKLTDPLTGNLYDMPVNDYEDFLSFIRTDSELSEEYSKTGKLRDTATPADYIDYVFNKSKRKKLVQEGCGHITLLEYDPFYQLLRVTFANNGNVVVYFRVPGSVANVLIALAQSGAKGTGRDGKPRHLLGINFWDLVRIRGTIHGSRYAFEYTEGGPTGQPSGRKQGGYYQVTSQPTVRDLGKLVSDARVKARADGATVRTDKGLRAMVQDLKDARAALAEGDMNAVYDILRKYDLEERMDTTRAVYTPTGQLSPVDLKEKTEEIAYQMKSAKLGRKALLAGEESDYHSDLTDALDAYLSSGARQAESVMRDYVEPTVLRMDARAALLTSAHKRAYNNLGKPRIDDETMNEDIGVDIRDRSVAALLRQEQYLIKMGLWP